MPQTLTDDQKAWCEVASWDSVLVQVNAHRGLGFALKWARKVLVEERPLPPGGVTGPWGRDDAPRQAIRAECGRQLDRIEQLMRACERAVDAEHDRAS